MLGTPVEDCTNRGVPLPSRSPRPPWPVRVMVSESPGRYGGLAPQSALRHSRLSALYTEPSPLNAYTPPVTPLPITRSFPDPSKSPNTGGIPPSPTKSIDWSSQNETVGRATGQFGRN